MGDTDIQIPTYEQEIFTKNTRTMSDSEESTTSNYSESSAPSTGGLSTVAMFDDLIRLMEQARNEEVEDAFANFAEQCKVMWMNYTLTIKECKRLQNLLNSRDQECSDYEVRLKMARQMFDEEKKKNLLFLRKIDELEDQIEQVRDLLFKDQRDKVSEEIKGKLAFLHRESDVLEPAYNKNLSTIKEINSTGSILSDLSFSRSEDDMDLSRRGWKNRRARVNEGEPEPALKKRRASSNATIEIGPTDTVRATTTVHVSQKGPITATSVIESVPKNDPKYQIPTSDLGSESSVPTAPPAHQVFQSWDKESPRKAGRTMNNMRAHTLQPKTLVMPDSCVSCKQRMRFGKTALKCKDCRLLCHFDCSDDLPLPCAPLSSTPNHKNQLGLISDYTPSTCPMVPALVVHCVNEVEKRGLTELGIYRIPGSEKEVKSLTERFLKGKSVPPLSQMDVHVVCGCLKDFLRSLTAPIITYGLWMEFVRAVEAAHEEDIVPALHSCIAQLPQANRDTLAYLVLHLQRVAEAKACKMPTENLAKVFGPTVVGYSSDDPSPDNLLTETRQQIMVMENLIRLPYDYWYSFLDGSRFQPADNPESTPSLGRFVTPKKSSKKLRKQKYFKTPPSYK